MANGFTRMNMEHTALIFLHLPKTAGRTLDTMISRRYKASQIHLIDGRWVSKSMTDFKRLSPEKRAKIRFLHGHMPFGLHQFLPGPTTYVTMLRNPTDRVISYYYYVQRSPEHNHYQTASTLSLDSFVRSELSTEFDNNQTRLLSGCWDEGIPFGECSPELVERAWDNVQKHFAFVGLMDRFDESILFLKKVLGWRLPPIYIRLNTTKNRPELQAVPKNTRDLIAEYSELDWDLYETVKESFEEKVIQAGIDQEQVKQFRSLNTRINSLPTLLRRTAFKLWQLVERY